MVASRQSGERACGHGRWLMVFRDNLDGNTGFGGFRNRDFQDAPGDGRQRRGLLRRLAIFRAGAGIKTRAAVASFPDRSAWHRHGRTWQYLGQLENQPEDQGDGRFHVHGIGMSIADCRLFQMIFVDLDQAVAIFATPMLTHWLAGGASSAAIGRQLTGFGDLDNQEP